MKILLLLAKSLVVGPRAVVVSRSRGLAVPKGARRSSLPHRWANDPRVRGWDEQAQNDERGYSHGAFLLWVCASPLLINTSRFQNRSTESLADAILC